MHSRHKEHFDVSFFNIKYEWISYGLQVTGSTHSNHILNHFTRTKHPATFLGITCPHFLDFVWVSAIPFFLGFLSWKSDRLKLSFHIMFLLCCTSRPEQKEMDFFCLAFLLSWVQRQCFQWITRGIYTIVRRRYRKTPPWSTLNMCYAGPKVRIHGVSEHLKSVRWERGHHTAVSLLVKGRVNNFLEAFFL